MLLPALLQVATGKIAIAWDVAVDDGLGALHHLLSLEQPKRPLLEQEHQLITFGQGQCLTI